MIYVSCEQVNSSEKRFTTYFPGPWTYTPPETSFGNVAEKRGVLCSVDQNSSLVFNLIKLGKIGELPENWNGYGAHPLSNEVIERAKRILALLPYQPFLAPTARNSIQFEYEKPWKDYMEIEIFKDHIELYSVKEGVEREMSFHADDTYIEQLRKEVQNFCE